MKTLSIGAVCAFATVLAAGTAAAQERLPINIDPLPSGRLPAGFTPRTLPGLPTVCHVDPAVASVTLTKGSRPGQVSVSYEVVNRGRSAWTSGARQQSVSLQARNANTGRVYRSNRALPTSAGAGSSMLNFSSPMISNAFDDFEFGGDVEVAIAYHRDIYIDGNSCNDDSSSTNNQFRVENAEVMAFLRGTATSRTFR
jgi:hypothetical protein